MLDCKRGALSCERSGRDKTVVLYEGRWLPVRDDGRQRDSRAAACRFRPSEVGHQISEGAIVAVQAQKYGVRDRAEVQNCSVAVVKVCAGTRKASFCRVPLTPAPYGAHSTAIARFGNSRASRTRLFDVQVCVGIDVWMERMGPPTSHEDALLSSQVSLSRIRLNGAVGVVMQERPTGQLLLLLLLLLRCSEARQYCQGELGAGILRIVETNTVVGTLPRRGISRLPTWMCYILLALAEVTRVSRRNRVRWGWAKGEGVIVHFHLLISGQWGFALSTVTLACAVANPIWQRTRLQCPMSRAPRAHPHTEDSMAAAARCSYPTLASAA